MHTIVEAVRENVLDRVKTILVEDPMAIECEDESGIKVYFLAAQYGYLELVKYIVEYSRASMNAVDQTGNNILHYAARSTNVELLDYLIKYVGISPLEANYLGETPFDVASKVNVPEIMCYLDKEMNLLPEKMYHNPVISGAHPDPSIVRVGDDYYMVNSSFTYFPCIPISHSKDLVNWHIIGHAITDPSYLNLDELEDGRGIWAPDISYYKGRFYIVATYRLNDGGNIYRRQLVVSADHPEGPYSKPVFIDEDGIDPSIFTDDDGRRYMLLNRGARIFEVSEDCTEQLSEAKLIWYGDHKRAPEGPHLLKKDGYYYLFVAEGGTGPLHRISVSRSKYIMGPYESCPYNPIMNQKNPLGYIQRAGHGKPVQTQNGEWYMVYLCGRPIDGKWCILGRETALDPIYWTQDGWPLVNGGKGPSSLQYKPNLKERIWENKNLDRFDEGILSKNWQFMRLPDIDAYEFVKDGLLLKGSPMDLKLQGAKNFIVQRQKNFCFEVETKCELVTKRQNESLGIVCYYDTLSYIKYGMVQNEAGYILQVVSKNDADEKVQFQLELNKVESICLKVITNDLVRSFWYSLDGIVWHKLGELNDVYYLSDEGVKHGKRFTGAMVGLYVLNDIYNKWTAYGRFNYFYYKCS